MEWKLFADLAEVAGADTVDVEVGDDGTVEDALASLLERHPPLEDRILDDGGELREHINVLRNGESIRTEDGLETAVESGDELALFPPVSGG
ncbi:MAG: ubiquitin-like small modifier protein 1 [Haloferacaceae archaeon]